MNTVRVEDEQAICGDKQFIGRMQHFHCCSLEFYTTFKSCIFIEIQFLFLIISKYLLFRQLY